MYSIVMTKGVNEIKQEIGEAQGEPPMIEKPNYICNTDLMVLMMSGKANGNVGAYTAMG